MLNIQTLPPPPADRTGWPWTEAPPPLPPTRPDGKDWPKITIVTPSYNQGQFIEETIRSVLLQGYPNLEYMIIDGGSNDDTVEIIRKYEAHITYWQSKKDRGQADAINQGLQKATGIWFHNVNSDDLLGPEALREIGSADLDADFLAGDVLEFDGDGERGIVQNVGLEARMFIDGELRSPQSSWHQPGVIMKTANLLGLGGYPDDLDFLFDRFTTCLYLGKHRQGWEIKGPVAQFRLHAEQKTHDWATFFEREEAVYLRKLSVHLESSTLRRLAYVEAMRRTMMAAIVGVFDEGDSYVAAAQVLSCIRSAPRLLMNRMFLGSLLRKPAAYLSVLTKRPSA